MGKEFVEGGGGWRPYSRVWQALHLGRGGAADLRTRVSGARLGGGEFRVLFLDASTQAGMRVDGNG